VDMNAAGDVYFYDDANKDFVKEDGYITFDAKIGYLIGAWDFYVYGENLTDEEYIVDYISNSMLAMADFGDPLTVGAGVRYRF
jgi:iron complex outermembrane receptor protein